MRGRSKRLSGVKEEILEILKDVNLTTNRIVKILKERGFSMSNITAKSYLEEMEKEKKIKSTKADNSAFTIVFWSHSTQIEKSLKFEGQE